MNHELTATISWGSIVASIIGFLLTLAFGAWAFVVKHFGQQHIDTIKDLATEIKELRREMNQLTMRVTRVEFAQQHFHPEGRDHD